MSANRERKINKQKRKDNVLGHIIREYVSSSRPVSSKNVTERMDREFSSATIRNIMGKLEDEGFLRQPHTSAGRIPTDRAYRHYVNRIRDRIYLERKVNQRIEQLYAERVKTLKEIIERTSHFISRELHKASIVMWPCIEDTYLKHIDFLKTAADDDNKNVLAVIVTMTNAVKHYILELKESKDQDELNRAANYLNDNYVGASFIQISDNLDHTRKDARARGENEILKLAASVQELIEGILKKSIENEIYWEGLDYFMEEESPEDIRIAKSLVRAVTKRHDLVRLLRRDLGIRGMRVYIGEECGKDLRGLSIITCGYDLKGRTAGRLGVIGSTRMDYEKVLGTVSLLTEQLSLQLREIKK